MTTFELKQIATKIITETAGSPNETFRLLKRYNLRYVKVRKGGLVKYIIRSSQKKHKDFKTIIKL